MSMAPATAMEKVGRVAEDFFFVGGGLGHWASSNPKNLVNMAARSIVTFYRDFLKSKSPSLGDPKFISFISILNRRKKNTNFPS